MFDFHFSQSVIGCEFLGFKGDLNVAIGFRLFHSFRPILVAFPTASFEQICDHDNDVDILLPNHAPESLTSVTEWPLSGNVGIGFLESVDVIGVDVIRSLFLPSNRQKSDATMIICEGEKINNMTCVYLFQLTSA